MECARVVTSEFSINRRILDIGRTAVQAPKKGNCRGGDVKVQRELVLPLTKAQTPSNTLIDFSCCMHFYTVYMHVPHFFWKHHRLLIIQIQKMKFSKQ